MPQLNIQGTIINFPDSGESPNWAPAVIQFAQAVEEALSAVAGPFDVSPQIFVMTSNANSNVSLPNLAFPTSSVRGAFIRYSVFRTTSLNTVSESGNMIVTYNPDGPIGNKWEIIREYVGNAQVTFSITDVGQIQFSSSLLTGTGHAGTISYAGQALLQS